MQRIMGQVFQGVAWIFLAGLLFQFYLVGAALFGTASLQSHRMLGFTLATLAILLPIVALIGRMGRQKIILALVLLLLTVIQAGLPGFRSIAPWVAALHAVNAVALVGVTIRLARPNTESASLATVAP
jgi:hypothetical protein